MTHTTQKEPLDLPRFLSVPEAANRAGVSRMTMLRWCDARRVPGIVRVGQSYGIPEDAELPTRDSRGRRPVTA